MYTPNPARHPRRTSQMLATCVVSVALMLGMLGSHAQVLGNTSTSAASQQRFPLSDTAQPAATLAAVTITVDRSDDPESDSVTRTCTYTSGVYNAATDGCTLRRALLEAGARPASDHPIAITFGLDISDPGYDSSAEVWTLTLDDAVSLEPDTITQIEGNVTIDGDTQPGGRSDGPKVYIDTNDHSLEIEKSDNTIRNLGFVNGGAIFLKEDGNTIEGITMGLSVDGQSIVFRTPSDPRRMAHGGVFLDSNNNTIQNNVISGAFAPAINLDGGSDNNTITNNYIGTRSDGTVPEVPAAIECLRNFNLDPTNWYGGWGLSIAGSGNQVTGNTIAGLHILQSANDTPPRAMEINGANHLIQGNRIGLDTADKRVGVCGQAIKLAGRDTQVLQNTIVRSRTDSEDAPTAAIFTADTSPMFGQMTIRENIVDEIIVDESADGDPAKIYGFGQGIPDAFKQFAPAQVTAMTDSAISGTSGADSPCPNCIIDLYLDNNNEHQDALSYLGNTNADADGNWTFPLSSPIPADRFVRTSSTSTTAGVIHTYGAGTTSKFSQAYRPITGLSITGPTEGDVETEYTFEITASPQLDEESLNYTLEVTDGSSPLEGQLDSSIVARYIWRQPGTKTINVTVSNSLGSVSETYTINIGSTSSDDPPADDPPADDPPADDPPADDPPVDNPPVDNPTVYLPLIQR